jgi:hypothetical protein
MNALLVATANNGERQLSTTIAKSGSESGADQKR